MPLKTTHIKVTIPGEFEPLIEQRMKEEKIASKSKYALSLILYDLFTRSRHTISAQIVHEPEEEFYRAVNEIVKAFPNAKNEMSEWLKKRIKDDSGA